MRAIDPSYAAPALSRAEAAIGRAFGGRVVPPGPASPPVRAYCPPVRCHVRGFNRRTRERNLAGLSAWIQGRLDFASAMPAAEREAYCTKSADYLHGLMLSMGCPDAPASTRGLEAVDLELAALRLAAAS